MTELAADTSRGSIPLAVRSLFGTWMAMLCTLDVLVELMPAAIFPSPVSFSPKVVCNSSNGRRMARSKIDPRST